MNVGPYTKVVRDSKWTPDGSPVEIRGIIYGAYNAHGLIGSEYNGIALFDETNLQVITDNVFDDIDGIDPVGVRNRVLAKGNG